MIKKDGDIIVVGELEAPAVETATLVGTASGDQDKSKDKDADRDADREKNLRKLLKLHPSYNFE